MGSRRRGGKSGSSRFALTLIALVAIVTAGCGGHAGAPSIAVGSATDPESKLVAHLYAAALRSYGSPAHVQSVPDPLTELDSGASRVVPGLTGELLQRFEPDGTARSAAQVYRAMVSALPEGVAAGDYTTSAEDKPAMAITKATADSWGGRDVAVAARNCAKLSVGAVAGTRPPSAIGVCKLLKSREYHDEATLFAALKAGQINAAWTTTATPNIPDDLLTMSDRTSLIRAENLVPLYRRNELSEGQVLAVNEVAGVLDTAALAQMRGQVANGTDPGLVADGYLAEHPLGR
ncbi:MAG TPA: glycine betaine ABC transporter substrate-binding protein [Mycobacterium sp.]|nr:glycine betaine ABC transporter substrate-binding protein [Mycobacterium sp.]